MRDTAALTFIAVVAGAALFHPWIGIMGWTFLSIMNPHRYSWAVSVMPVAAIMAVAVFLGMLVTKDRIRFLVTPTILVFMLFMLWMTVTLPFSIYLPKSFEYWKQMMKIDGMILAAVAVLHTRQHIIALVWVLVLSLGFYGVKAGLFTIATGGDYLVWGPPASFIEGNNELALALIMTIPLMRFLQLQYSSKWIRYGFWIAMLLTATAALGTHSRGALLALIGMAIVLWTRTRFKVVSALVLVIIGIGLIAFMPGQWDKRMVSIANYEQDESAQGRINAWWMAYNLATDRFFGGGYDIYRVSVFQQYAPNPTDLHAAHSIYFQILGEHGFVGLALFLLLWALVWGVAGWLRRNGRRQPESAWTSDLGSMVQASLAGYAVGGAFLSLAYFDLPYNLMLLVVIAKRWVLEKEWQTERATAVMPQPLPLSTWRT